MSREVALAALESAQFADLPALLRAASAALDNGLAGAVVQHLTAANERYSGDARLWQFIGLAHRELQDSAAAHLAFERAARLAPVDPLIAHSQARTALEAGYPAVALFNRARQLAPGDGAVVLGRCAALYADGSGAAACSQLADLLRSNPGWSEGHLAYARLAAQVDPNLPLDATVRAALALHPQAGALWEVLLKLWMEARDYGRALRTVEQARAALGPSVELARVEAACLTELDQAEQAERILDGLPAPINGDEAIWPIRNLIRLGRTEAAQALAEADFAGRSEGAVWPYRALLWRLHGDPRWEWLEGDPRFIAEYELAAEIGPLDHLADVLRDLHRAKGQPLDQSVRLGTQTDGNLLARAEPEIRRLRAALLDAVASYVAQLPAPDPNHPLLIGRRDALTVAGSWSVRLTGGGHHADHVHWQGWISSACYIAVPPIDPRAPESGWLALGECRELLPELAAFRMVEPKPGKLALFPSTLWHGTRPFGNGERMTVAYDIARPRQS